MKGALALPALKLILVEIQRGLADWDYADCAAPFWRLYWNAAGRGIVGFAGRSYSLEGRTLLLIPPETHFSARAESPMDHLYLHFLAGPPFDRAEPCVAPSRASPAELGELRALAGLAGGAEAAASRAAALRAAALCYGRLALFPPELLPASAAGELAARVAELVLSVPGRPRSNAQIASELGMSVPTLERAMRAQAGRSLHAFALWSRIGEACIRLRHSADSVEQIAEDLGFSDRSHFCRTFARLRGESPSAYRASSP